MNLKHRAGDGWGTSERKENYAACKETQTKAKIPFFIFLFRAVLLLVVSSIPTE
jgi:hypothetical protein